MVLLSDELLGKFQLARVFKDNTKDVTSIDFSADGGLVVTASEDESVRLYKVATASEDKVLYSKKYGVDLVRFTHDPRCVICASRNDGWDDTLRYWSLHDNRYLRYFKGHRGRVVSLSMSPTNDTFLSGSLDTSVRLWDLRSSSCQGMLRCSARPVCAFDTKGLVFAVAAEGNKVKLFDSRSYDNGPFDTFTIPSALNIEWKSISFSNNGKYLMLTGTKSSTAWLVDAFDGGVLHRFMVSDESEGVQLASEGCFSPDSRYAVVGGSDGRLHCYNNETGNEVATLHSHTQEVNVVRWHPSALMLASSCVHLGFWVPDI